MSPFYRLLLLPVVSSLILFGGCDDIFPGGELEDAQDELRETVDEKEELWQEQNITDYRLRYRQQVGVEPVDSVTVEVTGGTFDSVVAMSSVSEEALIVKDVDSFFDLIRERVGKERVLDWSADFNDSLGYPTRYEARFDDRPSEQVQTLDLMETTE